VLALTGVGSYPVTVHLISYVNPVAPNFGLDLPAGLYGYVVNDTANSTIDAVIGTTPPQSLVWNGGDGNWNTTSPNWQGGKVFANGDGVTFDDTAAGTTSVNISGSVTLGSEGVLVTNETKPYSLLGGSILGSATMTKDGSSSLTIDANSALALNINGGTVNGSGSLGATTVSTNAVLNYSGTISKLTTSGTADNSGVINIGVSVEDGVFNNSGTINGSFATSGDSVVTNTSASSVQATGKSVVDVGSTLVQNGEFDNNSDRLSINGTLTGSGSVYDYTGDTAGNKGRLEINAGGIFTPGGADMIGSFYVGGRFDLNAGTPDGTMIIDVDLNNPQTNDVIHVDKWSNFRGALVMNNIGSIPFASGQSFTVFVQNFGQPNTPEAAFDLQNKITPASPGIGLQWDISNLKTNGIIAVVAAPLTPPTLTSTSDGTNITIAWPTTSVGYQLQVQTNSLDVGLGTNWVPVLGTETNTSYTIPISSTNPAVFYRLSNQ
jgi:hypothetical protein